MTATGQAAAGADGGQATGGADGGGQAAEVFTRADLNRAAAEARRKADQELSAARKNQEAYTQLQSQVESLLQGKPIDEIRAEMDATATKLRSVEEQSKLDNAKFAKQLQTATERAAAAETRYVEMAVSRALTDAAAPVASTSAMANHIADILRKSAKVDNNGVVTVEMEVTEEGVTLKKALTPTEAVAILESQPAKYGPLFKSGVGAGTGSAGAGLAKTPGGGIDISKLTMAQYAELRAKNPELLGV